ncbi:glycogen/starch synthase [Pseudoalteromonas sp. MMG022]|uniref:glycogen synthase n=1 Tax=Pseudoalteromonas sp. MMG022 TaxID=2909978 RepID=UPI001F2BF4C0|nr:glycogen/starch synthase [Pseudoalteromonas sp. MMG022]MCF6434363.1 glycogen/starch synthase [Pseudoalteromonas sp. MMG022]
MRVLMVAAENDRLPNCKVGGVADVIRDIPYALSNQGVEVSVVVPDYGQSHLNRTFVSDIAVPFRQHLETATLWQVEQQDGVTQYVISHSLFSQHHGEIYCNDEGHRPFATDATKFAFFSAAVSEAIEHKMFAQLDVLHLHDWHAACVAVLKKFSPRFVYLKQLKTIYTVHNLALQGIRPFNHDESSLEAWFPTLSYDGQILCDHQHPHCFNPMRSAIALADKVHVVSPTYGEEVLHTSEPDRGFFGGEGLEHDMQIAKRHGKLVGILNGCEYPNVETNKMPLQDYLHQVESELLIWMSKQTLVQSSHYIAHQRLRAWLDSSWQGPLITSVGRLTDQKALLLRQPIGSTLLLDELAKMAAAKGARIVILGSGDKYLESLFTQVMARNDNLLYLCGYGQSIGDMLYQLGDLFLMPSSFEPCGISQMLAMRAGQPCLVHQVGGLADTVKDLENGFSFSGEDLPEQVSQLLEKFDFATSMYVDKQEQYQQLASNAAAARFTWLHSASLYIEQLYQ